MKSIALNQGGLGLSLRIEELGTVKRATHEGHPGLFIFCDGIPWLPFPLGFRARVCSSTTGLELGLHIKPGRTSNEAEFSIEVLHDPSAAAAPRPRSQALTAPPGPEGEGEDSTCTAPVGLPPRARHNRPDDGTRDEQPGAGPGSRAGAVLAPRTFSHANPAACLTIGAFHCAPLAMIGVGGFELFGFGAPELQAELEESAARAGIPGLLRLHDRDPFRAPTFPPLPSNLFGREGLVPIRVHPTQALPSPRLPSHDRPADGRPRPPATATHAHRRSAKAFHDNARPPELLPTYDLEPRSISLTTDDVRQYKKSALCCRR